MLKEPTWYSSWSNPYGSTAKSYDGEFADLWLYEPHDTGFLLRVRLNHEGCIIPLVIEVNGVMPPFNNPEDAPQPPRLPKAAEPQPPSS